MFEGSLNISKRTLIIIICFLLILIGLIFILDKIDDKRKFNQFKELNTQLSNSSRTKEIKKILHDSDVINNNEKIKKIFELVDLIEQETEMYPCKVYLKQNGKVYVFGGYVTNNNYKSAIITNYIPKIDQEIVTYLEQEKYNNMEEKYKITSNYNSLWAFLKIDSAYIIANSNYRH